MDSEYHGVKIPHHQEQMHTGADSIRRCLTLLGPGLLYNFGPLEQDCQKTKGAHSLQHFLLQKCRFDQHQAGAMSRAGNRQGTLVGYVKGLFALSFSPAPLVALFFLVLIVPEPLYFSMQSKASKICSFFPLNKVVETGLHYLHFSQTPPFARPSISLVFPLYQKIY